MTTFPPELVEIIVYEAWHSEMPSYVRKRLMTTFPRINRTWKAVYAPIASQDMYITNFAFLGYLCRIARLQKSIIYHDFIPRLTRTITCFVNLEEYEMEREAKEVYLYLTVLPNLRGFDALFKFVRYISFRLYWISIGSNSPFPILSLKRCRIHARYNRFLSNDKSSHRYERRAEMTPIRICFSLTDPGSSMDDSMKFSWMLSLTELRGVGVPRHLFKPGFFPPERYERAHKGIRYVCHTTHIYEMQLGFWDSKNINRRMWVASKGRHNLFIMFDIPLDPIHKRKWTYHFTLSNYTRKDKCCFFPLLTAKKSIFSSLVWFSDEHTDIYGMPQATFHVERSENDAERDHRMMNDMTNTANFLGGYLPGSEPQFMAPGLALHVTGTTRIGATDNKTSVADPSSKVYGYKNLWVGGNGCIPDSTACNPTLTSVAIAIKGAESIVNYIKKRAE
ncbi:hypothetical protein IW262DRAFT_1485193 [Armillaria fumosa]|nr:hypothetical protein IW262DRAFT_1485193 [Armillaria fumosa]